MIAKTADIQRASCRGDEGSGPPSICIVSLKAYGALCGGCSGHIGGVEWQTSFLARSLARRGYHVSMLTWNEGGPTVEYVDGVRIIVVARPASGLRGLRFFHPRWTGLIKAMQEADATVYYQNGAECTTGQVALWCKQRARSFVFSIASDMDCVRSPIFMTKWLERMLYRFGLRRAVKRIVQTQSQRRRLFNVFGLDSTVIPMPCPGPTEFQATGRSPRLRVLWIGRVYDVKRPDRLLDLVSACPEVPFDLVGPFYSDAYAQRVQARARQLRNLVVHGAVRRELVSSFYSNAACLCCTSDYEGFPNTFLEAWSHGLPIVSTFDPDGIIAKRKLGFVVKTVPEMQSSLRSLLASPGLRREFSGNARRYFLENHRPEAVLPRFEQVFREACLPAGPRPLPAASLQRPLFP